MQLGRERHFFAGGNTPAGFINFFKEITSPDEKEIYILKGGPGTGKSRMMKKISRAAVLEGYDVEIIRCSSDCESFDGIRIPELKKTVLDGTAPHVVDMDMPGARDRIINLGDFWNEDKLREHKKDIEELNREKSICVQRAHGYLKAAGEIRRGVDKLYESSLSEGKLNIFIQRLCDNFFRDIEMSCKAGRVRRMFGTAITDKGIVNVLPTLFRGMKVYAMRCENKAASNRVLETLQREALLRGFLVESCVCPFSPEKAEHIIIPRLSLAFTTYNGYHEVIDCEVFGEYLLDAYFNDIVLEGRKEEIEYDDFRVRELIEKAERCLSKAKAFHKKTEEYYSENMDFPAINQCTENIIEIILK